MSVRWGLLRHSGFRLVDSACFLFVTLQCKRDSNFFLFMLVAARYIRQIERIRPCGACPYVCKCILVTTNISNSNSSSSMPESLQQQQTRLRRMPLPGGSHIGKVLEEARLEICHLEQNNNKMETALADLQNWLSSTHSTAGTSETVTSSVHDVSKMQAHNVSAAMQTSVSCDEDSLKRENENLKEQLAKLRDITKKLTSDLENRDQDTKSKRDALKQRLSSSSFVSQQFQDNGVNSEGNVTKRRKSVATHDESANSILDSTNVDELHRQLCDVLEKNVRWQTYNSEREQYVGNLLNKYNQVCVKLQEARDKLAHITSNPDKLAAEQRRHYDNVLIEARQELEKQRSETNHVRTESHVIRTKVESDMKQLKAEVEYWRRRYEEQRTTLATITANYESERRRSSNSLKESKQKQSQIQLLQSQVQLFSEDFRAERKEKEIAETEMLVLRNKVQQLQQKIEILHKKPNVSFSDVMFDEFAAYDDVYNHDDVTNRSGRGRRAVSPPKPFPRRRDKTPTDVTSVELTRSKRAAPAPPSERKARSAQSLAVAVESRRERKARDNRRNAKKRSPDYDDAATADTLLHCPGCDKVYDVTQHLELLKHIDVCGD